MYLGPQDGNSFKLICNLLRRVLLINREFLVISNCGSGIILAVALCTLIFKLLLFSNFENLLNIHNIKARSGCSERVNLLD